jgi:hypothetical protein
LWSEAEVHALIQLQTNLDDMRRKGPKAPFWEEVSAGMRRMGYSRSSKRCMQKWGNINYYYKKAKDIKKKRPDDSKTGPSYFHQLEAFHHNKEPLGSPAGAGTGGAANAALRNGVGWSNLDMLWAGISAGEGWSTKECMEKWGNMSYHSNKVNESNKKRPEDSKACPSHFHQLEALYHNKAAIGCSAGDGGAAAEHGNAAPQDRIEAFAVRAPIPQTAPQPYTLQPPVAKNGVTITNNKGNGHDVGGVSGGTQMQASTGAGNRFVLPKLPVRRSTISVKAEVEEFLKGFTDVMA